MTFEQARDAMLRMDPAELEAFGVNLSAEVRFRVLLVFCFDVGARAIELSAVADEFASTAMRRLDLMPPTEILQ